MGDKEAVLAHADVMSQNFIEILKRNLRVNLL